MGRKRLLLRFGALGIGVALALAPGPAASASKSVNHHAKHHKAPKKSGNSTASFNSCSVVTQAEAASALGSSVTPGVLGNAVVEGGFACVFYGPSAPTPSTPNVGQPDSVRVVVVKGPNALTFYNNYKSSPEVRAKALTGYGQQSYYDGYASLNVLKGVYYIRIAVVPAGSAPSLSDEENLANAILPKL